MEKKKVEVGFETLEEFIVDGKKFAKIRLDSGEIKVVPVRTSAEVLEELEGKEKEAFLKERREKFVKPLLKKNLDNTAKAIEVEKAKRIESIVKEKDEKMKKVIQEYR